ncbi:MAG: tetratricopeptide repeat protein [Acidobacteriia bacterium]|nr:tetratricopeptide repeat protein [Terriglobia bacterium]
MVVRNRDLWIYFLLFAAVFAVYSSVRTHDFINYDDPVYVVANPHVRGGLTWDGLAWAFTSFEHSNWFPLTWISHMLDVEMFGLNAGSHHLSSVFLHALSALALFALLVRITRARWPSAFVALAFALHPLHVESVAWAAERKDVLSALFWIFTLLAYAWYVERPSSKRYAAVVALFICGLMSKPMVVTLPFLMLLLDYWPLKRKLETRLLIEKIPLFALSIAGSIIAFIAQRQSGAVAALDVIPFPLRAENALVTYITYLAKFAWPSNLAVFYPYADHIPAWQWIGAALLLAAITAAVLLARATRPYLAVGWLWYLGTLVPVIGLVQVGSQARADRYTYLPMIGIAILMAWLAADVIKSPGALGTAATIIGVIWAGATVNYLRAWQDSIPLFRHAIESTGPNWVAYNNLGGTLRRAGQINEAIANFENAARIHPGFADIEDNLGEALVSAGRVDEAIAHLNRAIQIQPKFGKAHVDLGAALMHKRDPAQAAAQFQEALRLDPSDAEARFRLGGILAAQGRMQEATVQFQAALPYLTEATRLNPDDPEARHNLGGVLGMMGRADDAAVEFAHEVRLRPNDPEAHYNLGLALASQQHFAEAAAQFERAAQLQPDYLMAHYNFARALLAVGRTVEAQQEFSRTLQIAPDFAPARQALARFKQQ